MVGRNVTSYGVHSLNKSLRLQTPKSRVFVLFIVSGKKQRETGWQMEEYIKSSCTFSLPAGWLLLAVLCRALDGEGYS